MTELLIAFLSAYVSICMYTVIEFEMVLNAILQKNKNRYLLDLNIILFRCSVLYYICVLFHIGFYINDTFKKK